MKSRALPKWFVISGWALLGVCLPFMMRIVYEKTYLTWQQGPQMIAFSLAHNETVTFITGVAAVLLCYAWVVSAFILLLLKRHSSNQLEWIQFAITGLIVGLLTLPEGLWQDVTSIIMGHRP